MVRKSFKREVAVALLIWLVYIVEVKDVSIIEVLVWPIFTFAAAAFGIDAYGKLQQRGIGNTNGRGTERSGSSQYSSGKDKLPDDWDNK
jgi:hypothetical protein